MKNLIYVFALSIATISCNNAQNNGVLAENNGQQLTEQQFQAYPTLIEFLVEEQLTASEVQRLREQAIQEFNNNPAVMMQDVASTQQAIESIKAMQDATQVGLTRQTLLAELHKASLLQGANAPNSEFTNIIQAHAPVIAYDPQSNLVITEKNIEGIAGYYNFMYQLYGYDYRVSTQEVQQFRQQMAAGFNSLPLDQKQMFCVMSTMNQVMRSAWAQMTIAEQQQYQQQLIAQANGGMNNNGYQNNNTNNYNNNNSNKSLADQQAELRTKQMYYNIMNDMSMQSHVTSLNIIENIGGSGNYWEITNNPW